MQRKDTSHVFLLIFLFIIVIIFFVFLLFSLLGFFFSLLLVILFLLACLLLLVDFLPLGRKFVSFSLVISDDDIVKDGLSLHLPQVKANEAEIRVLVHGIIIDLRIVYLLGLPDTLVFRIGDSLGLPIT